MKDLANGHLIRAPMERETRTRRLLRGIHFYRWHSIPFCALCLLEPMRHTGLMRRQVRT